MASAGVSRNDHYSVLGLEDRREETHLSTDLVKAAYRQALLKHHPDRSDARMVAPVSRQATTPTIDDISLAYRILSDPTARKDYDLSVLHATGPAGSRSTTATSSAELVDLEDLAYDQAKDVWTRDCRCGSLPAYVVTESDLEVNAAAGELTVGCQGCSLWIRVMYSIAD